MTHPEIFKAYDIRGIYPEELNEETVYAIGRAYALLRQKEVPNKRLSIVVGGDMRLSTPALKRRLIESLIDGGVNVVDVGLVSTPTFYFAVAYYGYDGGIQVSASHNPKEYNGLKLVRDRALPIGRDTGMKELQSLAMTGNWPATAQPGQVTQQDNVLTEAVRQQTSDVDLSAIKPFTIVVDAANAMGALDVRAMFQKLPCKIIEMNFELDGNFPVHQPDPLDPDNLEVLQQAVVAHQADLGIAPDGDGDRYFFVDEKGQIVRQEIVRGLMAQRALRQNPGATVCYDIRPGRITRDLIEVAGGKAVVTPVGHSLIKKVMLDVDAVFGGESSGHFFYKFSYGTFEAPMQLVVNWLLWMSAQELSLSAAIQPYQRYFHSGEINSTVQSVTTILEKVKAKYQDSHLNTLDGLTVEYDDWWFNIRGSNTEPLIRLNLEAKSSELMVAKRDEVLAIIRSED